VTRVESDNTSFISDTEYHPILYSVHPDWFSREEGGGKVVLYKSSGATATCALEMPIFRGTYLAQKVIYVDDDEGFPIKG